ncbi:MAG: PEP-CTERM sorting domain-containing protein [Pirellulales bacterium]
MKAWFTAIAFGLIVATAVLVGDSAQGARIAFLVAEYPGQEAHGDSFVISIDSLDTDRLQHARLLVDWISSGANPENAPDGRIVVSAIAPGTDGVNRDWRAAGHPVWSWHPVGEVSFADSTIELIDGWPTFVEQDVPGWMSNTNGNIGFWSYTVVQELGVVPEPAGAGLVTIGAIAVGVSSRRRRS